MENNIFHRWGLRILIELLLQFSRSFAEHRYALPNFERDELILMLGIMHSALH